LEQAVKDDESGKILIRRPTNGGPFHVSRNSIDKVISNLGNDARYQDASEYFGPFVSEISLSALSHVLFNRWCKIWAATFAASGALLLGVGGYAAMC
jgi:hypothetical protein